MMIYKSSLLTLFLAQAEAFAPATNNVQRAFSLFSTAESEFRAPTYEIERRRNLAIISHPDSG